MDMGRGEEKVRCMERVTWKLTYYMWNSQWEFSVCLRKLKQGLSINLEGWDRERDGRDFQKVGYMYTHGWFMLRFERKQKNSVKQLSFNKNKLIKKNSRMVGIISLTHIRNCSTSSLQPIYKGDWAISPSVCLHLSLCLLYLFDL